MTNTMQTGRSGAYRLNARDRRKSEQALGYVLWCALIVVLVTVGN